MDKGLQGGCLRGCGGTSIKDPGFSIDITNTRRVKYIESSNVVCVQGGVWNNIVHSANVSFTGNLMKRRSMTLR